MFRIDRRFVKLTASGVRKANSEEKREVDAEGEVPEAATSAELPEIPSYNDVYMQYETEAEAQAQEILTDAKTKAAQLIEDAQDEIEEQRQRAYDEGHAEGFSKGDLEGRQIHDDKLNEQLRENEDALKRVLDEIARERENTLATLEEEITTLSLEIVKKIINPAEEELNNVFTSLIKNALRQMPTDGKFIIRVAPNEYEKYFSSGSAAIELDSGTIVTATILRDVALEDGDCVIDTEDVTVNAGLPSQFNYVKLAFERANQYEPD
ncbi:MAG: FliH/SctL family protein [Oscillospiraceae bacterium]|nr:FliH/SctL family protein [Oscillospiraceae bacterium]